MPQGEKFTVGFIVYALILLFHLWVFGYLFNGVHEHRFDLASCWLGFATIASAATVALLKFLIDSVWNSKPGSSPGNLVK